MKLIKFLLLGMLFGITLSKAEVISWFRIQEMFRFESFHMFGVIGTAVLVNMIVFTLFKTEKIKDFQGNKIEIARKAFGKYRNIVGGIIFGMGWALVGTCTSPMFILLGKGVLAVFIVLIGALLGAFAYGMLRDKLPH